MIKLFIKERYCWKTILKESYWGLNMVERRVKLNNKTPFRRKILTVFDDNIGLIIYWKRVSTIQRYFVFFKNLM